jgi:hypothetical protein
MRFTGRKKYTKKKMHGKFSWVEDPLANDYLIVPEIYS